jgi:hypothetical protein
MNSAPVFESGIFRVVCDDAAFEAGDARIVHDNIQASLAGDDLSNNARPVRLFTNIQADESRAASQFRGKSRSV